jgi:chemotaxis protein MotB
MYNNEQKNEENFWISYADLMAGLLFVFILVLGTIVIKYVYTQNNLEKEKLALNQTQEELTDKNEVLNSLNTLIKKLEDEKSELSSTVKLNNDELQRLKDLIVGYEAKDKEQQETNTKLAGQITLKDEELLVISNKLLDAEKTHQKTVEEFNITKDKIKRLTGIKLNVIKKLKEKLGNSINIDEKSGAIKFSSNILFDQSAYKLKDSSKKELDVVLKKYISTLLEDKEIRKYIHGITIEGHTNSDGSYLSNLQLSQQRALEVMQFLYESNSIDKDLLNKYVSSSGKSSSDLIYKNGVEDKDASRRIEIKFIIKNEEAVKELQNYLGEKE